MSVRVVKQASVFDFIVRCKKEGWQPEQIVEQLQMFTSGMRDSRLSDNTIILMDGEFDVPANVMDMI